MVLVDQRLRSDKRPAPSDAGFGKVGIELHQVPRLQAVHPDVPDGRLDPFQEAGVAFVGPRRELRLSVVPHPAVREVGEGLLAAQDLAGLDLVLEQHGGFIDRLLDLPFGHTWLRVERQKRPCRNRGAVVRIGDRG